MDFQRTNNLQIDKVWHITQSTELYGVCRAYTPNKKTIRQNPFVHQSQVLDDTFTVGAISGAVYSSSYELAHGFES